MTDEKQQVHVLERENTAVFEADELTASVDTLSNSLAIILHRHARNPGFPCVDMVYGYTPAQRATVAHLRDALTGWLDSLPRLN